MLIILANHCGFLMFALTQAYADESFVLPALLRFGGEPFVDERTGALLYRFPALQRSGVSAVRDRAHGLRVAVLVP
jgi:hypothetical protein